MTLADSGSLEGLLTTRTTFYGGDATKPLLLLADGAYLEDQARADHLGGDQWGMMNETGNYPGQPWMWLYTFWYQVKPFSTSDNADALVWGLMVVLTLGLILLPFIPGLRALPRHLGVHRLDLAQPLLSASADRKRLTGAGSITVTRALSLISVEEARTPARCGFERGITIRRVRVWARVARQLRALIFVLLAAAARTIATADLPDSALTREQLDLRDGRHGRRLASAHLHKWRPRHVGDRSAP